MQLEIHAPPGDGVECAKGLIEQQQRGFKTERAGNCGALAHAAGELAGPRLFEALQTNQLDQVLHPGGVNGQAGNLERQRDVGVHREPGQQRMILEGNSQPVLVAQQRR